MVENIKTQTSGESTPSKPPEIMDVDEAEKLRAAEKKGDQMFKGSQEQLLAQSKEAASKKEWSAQAFEKEVQRLTSESPKALASFLERHQELLTEISVDSALKALQHCTGKPFMKSTLMHFTTNEPIITIADTCENPSFSKLPYYADVLKAAFQSNPSIIFEYSDVYQEHGLDVKKSILKAVKSDPWGFVDNFEDMKGFVENSEVLLKEQKGKIRIAENGRPLPGKTIEAADFPMQRKDFELYLLGVNKEATFIDVLTEPGAKDVFFSAPFSAFLKTQIGKLNFMNAFSVSQSVARELNLSSQPLNDETIGRQLEQIASRLEKAMARELIGPNTKLILFTHEEDTFQNDEILNKLYRRNGGKEENLRMSGKGVEMEGGKNKIKVQLLQAIRESRNGNVTILFSGHGFPENWTFSTNHHPDIDHSLESHPHTLSYRELGEALIDSGNIENINLIGACCYSYDFFRNLFDYLASKGVQERPALCLSFANKGKPSLGTGKEMLDPVLDTLYSLTKEGEPVQGKHFLKAEGQPIAWKHNDPALFSGGMELL